MIPSKPLVFTPDRAPAFVELKLDAYRDRSGNAWYANRPVIKPKLQLVHTNGATGEGSIESAINWGNANPSANTHPHYQVDRNRAAKLVPTNRKGIGNKTLLDYRGDHGDVADWSIVIETSDEGWPTPGNAGGFIGNQVEMIAQILAYEAILHGIPLRPPAEWWQAGTAAHTEPYGYPYWSNSKGKACPGDTKKRQLREVVVPRAREIYSAWTTVEPAPPTPPSEDEMFTWSPKGFANAFLIGAGPAMQLSPAAWQFCRDRKLPHIDQDDHPQMLKTVLYQAGLTQADLVPRT